MSGQKEELLKLVIDQSIVPIKIMLMGEGAYKDLVDTQTVKKRKDMAYLINFLRKGFKDIGQDPLVHYI